MTIRRSRAALLAATALSLPLALSPVLVADGPAPGDDSLKTTDFRDLLLNAVAPEASR